MESKRVMEDCLAALKAWRIWLYLGMQDVRNQFRRSRMGASWLVINLTLMAAGIGYVYGHLFHVQLYQFLPTLILGLIIWIFISTIIIQGCQTFILSEGYVKQFSLVKQVYLFRFLISALINLSIGFIIYFGVAYFTQVPMTLATLWFVPGLFLLLLINMAHLIIFAYWGARFRDLTHAASGFFQIIFYITPIVFTADMLKARGIDFVYRYNPLYYLIEVIRYPLLHHQVPPNNIFLFCLSYCLLVWLIALFTMVKNDSKVAYWL